jgi:hypothetical protein
MSAKIGSLIVSMMTEKIWNIVPAGWSWPERM